MNNTVKLIVFLALMGNLFTSAYSAPTQANKSKKNVPAAKVVPKFNTKEFKGKLLSDFFHTDSKKEMALLKKRVMKSGGKSVPVLVEVMKNKIYPDRSKWMATFLLGRIMGKKSAPYIAKYMDHPSWVMRMASLKTLLALKQTQYGGYFAKLLKDDSLIVRTQAIENIKLMGLTKYSPHIWSMLYDKKNYHQNKKTKLSKRTNIIKNAVTAIGDLKFEKAKEPLLKMIQKKRYDDMFEEVEYSLEQITGTKSPKGNRQDKRRFWKRAGLASLTL